MGAPESWAPLTREYVSLSTAADATTAAATQQSLNATQTTLVGSGEQALQAQLRAEMRAVTKVAQALRNTVPGIATLKMPSSNTQPESLLKAADAFIARATIYETVLAGRTLPADFITQMKTSEAKLKASVDGRGTSRAALISATTAVEENLRLGKQIIRIMDSALATMLKADPAKLAEWNSVKRVTVKGVQTPAVSATPAFTAPATAAATTTSDVAALPTVEPLTVAEAPAKAA